MAINQVKALEYCKGVIDPREKNLTLGFINVLGGRMMAANRAMLVRCTPDTPINDGCMPVSNEAVKSGERDRKPQDMEARCATPKADENASIFLSASDGLKATFKQWGNVFSLIKNNFRGSTKTGISIIEPTEKGLMCYSGGNAYPPQGLIYRLAECDKPKKQDYYWFNVKYWNDTCKILADLNPKCVKITFSKNAAVDIITDKDEMHIKFIGLRAGSAAAENMELAEFFGRTTGRESE